MAQTPNGFSQARADYAVLTPLGLLKQDTYDAFLKLFPDLANLGYIMTAEGLGALKYTPTRQYKHYLDTEKPLPSFQIAADVTGSAGANVVVTLAAASHEAAGTKSPVADGQIWEDDLTGKRYEVVTTSKTTASAHTATLNPVKSADATALTAAGSFFKFIGYVNTREASVRNPGIYRRWLNSTQETAIIRTDQTFTDLNAFEHTIINDQTFMMLSRSEEDERFVASQELQLMFGVSSDNLKTANNQNSASLGLIPQIKAAGAAYSAPTAGVINEDFFRGIKRRVSATGISNEFHGLLDTEATIKFDDFMNSYNANGSIVYASFGGQKEVAINRNFGSYSIYGMTFHRREYEYFNSARTHGADVNTGINRNTMLFIPQGSVAIEGEKFKTFNVRWQGEDAGAPIIRLVTDGALFGKSDEMIGSVGHVTYKGLQAFQLGAYSYITL